MIVRNGAVCVMMAFRNHLHPSANPSSAISSFPRSASDMARTAARIVLASGASGVASEPSVRMSSLEWVDAVVDTTPTASLKPFNVNALESIASLLDMQGVTGSSPVSPTISFLMPRNDTSSRALSLSPEIRLLVSEVKAQALLLSDKPTQCGVLDASLALYLTHGYSVPVQVQGW